MRSLTRIQYEAADRAIRSRQEPIDVARGLNALIPDAVSEHAMWIMIRAGRCRELDLQHTPPINYPRGFHRGKRLVGDRYGYPPTHIDGQSPLRHASRTVIAERAAAARIHIYSQNAIFYYPLAHIDETASALGNRAFLMNDIARQMTRRHGYRPARVLGQPIK